MAETKQERLLRTTSCPPGKDRIEVATGRKGLYLLITAKGARSWVWRGRDPQTKKQIKKTMVGEPFAEPGGVKLADAAEWASKMLIATAEGRDLEAEARQREAEAGAAAEKQAIDATKTLRWFWQDVYCPRYIPEERQKGNETFRLIEAHLIPELGTRILSQITTDELEDILIDMAETAPGSAVRLAVNIKTLFKRAKREFRRQTELERNPAEDLIAPEYEALEKGRSLPDEEIVYFYRAIEHLSGTARIHAECLSLLLDVGGRLNEARLAPWSEFDLDKSIWELPGERVKNRKAHIMVLPSEVVERLKARKRTTNSKWVFGSEVLADGTYGSLNKTMAKIVAKMAEIAARDGVEIARFSAHDMRRTFKSHLYDMAGDTLDPMLKEANVDRAQNHVTGSKMGRTYDKNKYTRHKAAIYRIWQTKLMGLRAEAVKAEKASSRVAEAA